MYMYVVCHPKVGGEDGAATPRRGPPAWASAAEAMCDVCVFIYQYQCMYVYIYIYIHIYIYIY